MEQETLVLIYFPSTFASVRNLDDAIYVDDKNRLMELLEAKYHPQPQRNRFNIGAGISGRNPVIELVVDDNMTSDVYEILNSNSGKYANRVAVYDRHAKKDNPWTQEPFGEHSDLEHVLCMSWISKRRIS